MTSYPLPLIDLRSEKNYIQGHLEESTHLPWPSLQERLNELPERPAQLNLLGNQAALDSAKLFLEQKGYQINRLILSEFIQEMTLKLPGLVKVNNKSQALWQPSSLVKEFVSILNKHQNITECSGLDIGCGGGRDAVYLAMQGMSITGIDRKEAVLCRAKNLSKYQGVRVNWLHCDLERLDCFPSKKQDVILIVRYLNRKLFSKIKEALNPRGWLVFQAFSTGCELFGSPKNSNFILRYNEFSEVFSDFEVFVDRIDRTKDGRPVASFIARKKEI